MMEIFCSSATSHNIAWTSLSTRHEAVEVFAYY